MEIETLKIVVPKRRINPVDNEIADFIATKIIYRYPLEVLYWSCGMNTFFGEKKLPFDDYPSVRSGSQFYPQKDALIIPSIFAVRFNGDVFYNTSRIDAYKKDIIRNILKEVETWK